VPQGYFARPDLDPALEFVWDAFWILSSDRSFGMGEGPIPFAAIDRYAQRYGLDDLAFFDEFRTLIGALDHEYLKIRADKAEREREREAGKTSGPV